MWVAPPTKKNKKKLSFGPILTEFCLKDRIRDWFSFTPFLTVINNRLPQYSNSTETFISQEENLKGMVRSAIKDTVHSIIC